MTDFKPIFERIDKHFNFKKHSFHLGIKELDDFYREHSREFLKYGYSQIYILKSATAREVIDFFSLSSSTLRWEESLDSEKITRYIPGILLGMFAIDERYRRKKYGSDLIKKVTYIAMQISNQVGCRCVFVDSLISLETINFYLNMGFKFIDIQNGKKILEKLLRKEKVERKTIKMYFDLYKIRK